MNGNTNRRQGSIVRLLTDKGFGFVRDQSDGREYFFHRTDLRGSEQPFELLREHQAVTFDVGESQKGPRAANVEVQTR